MSPTVMPGFSPRRRTISPFSSRESRCSSPERLGLTIWATGRLGAGNSLAGTPGGARYSMSAAWAQPAPSARASVTARTKAIMLAAYTTRLTRHVEEPANKALPLAHGRHRAAQPRIEAKAAARGFKRKPEHQQRQEHVGPRPLGRIAGGAEPELQRIEDGKHAYQSHAKPEQHRAREY